MSGFVALFHPDGRPAERARLAPLIGSIAYRGPDGIGQWAHQSIALGHALLAVSPARKHPQPVIRNGCAVVFAGRLDNRDELEALLDSREPDDSGDAGLVLAAYGRWGEESAARLLGDFAYAIWDGGRRTLVCARDAMGQKPLFYYASDHLVLVASEPRAILADPEVPRVIDEDVAAEYLTGVYGTPEATLFASIRRLRPAHLLIADERGCRTRRYWDFDRGGEIRYRRDAEYAEHFHELFARAVDCRLEPDSTTAIFLSGGLDSSAVTGVAAALARDRHVALRALALRFPGRACDEGVHIAAVARHTGVPLSMLDSVPAPPQAYRTEAAATLDAPTFPNGTVLNPLRAAARGAGARVVLTGYGGDDWFTGSGGHTTDLLRRGRLLTAWRQLRADARLPGRHYTVTNLARGAVAPLLPLPVRAMIRRLRRRPPPFDWLCPDFRRRTRIADRRGLEPVDGFPSTEQAEIYAVATCAFGMIASEMEERAAAAAGIEQRHPFHDRRLAAFALALPAHQRWAGRETKVVLRRAMELRSLAPAGVLAREDKAEFSSTYVDAVDAFGGVAAFARLRTADRGWVDAEKARAMYGDMKSLYNAGDDAYILPVDALWSILGLDLWLDALETNGHKQRSGSA